MERTVHVGMTAAEAQQYQALRKRLSVLEALYGPNSSRADETESL